MVLAVRKHLQNTNGITFDNFGFKNCLKNSIPGDVRAQVLQEPVGGSHADQGRKSEMPETFSDPGGQAGSNDTPYALSCMANNIFPGGGSCSNIYKDRNRPECPSASRKKEIEPLSVSFQSFKEIESREKARFLFLGMAEPVDPSRKHF